ncbi:hypothetical protein [Herbidospora sp. NBRC 101105]|uniref:hypothetical protein n=1 Tax=Herbidospora sp. NBRC 101105 TaxID=3032195 RepID=UPI0024A51FA7|nr:hypothetical protein [Herbidospora sp. NBRC 101105]GLX93738.1 hypothetical protein Hesp01_16880 [Herbidospora sp. NBRC 101105]
MRRDVAIVLSVGLAVVAGILSNILVDQWTWTVATFLVVVTAAVGGLEVLRRRMDDAKPSNASASTVLEAVRRELAGPGDPVGAQVIARLRAMPPHGDALVDALARDPDNGWVDSEARRAIARLLAEDPRFAREVARVTILGSTVTMNRSVIAGGDVDQSRRVTIGTGGLGVLGLALLLGGGVIGTGVVVGRQSAVTQAATTAATPPATPPAQTSPGSPPPSPSPVPSPSRKPFTGSWLIKNGHDLDPRTESSGLDDLSFTGDVGLTTLNNARLATAPTGIVLSPSACDEAIDAAGLDRVPTGDLGNGDTYCLRTSDGRMGTVSVRDWRNDALGGWIRVSWTIWR